MASVHGDTIMRCTLWALSNHVIRMVPSTSTFVAIPRAFRTMLSQHTGHAENTVAGAVAAAVNTRSLPICGLVAEEVQSWWFGTSSRVLLAALCILLAQW